MSNPLVHAERSARQWGGTPDDYLSLHQWFDATKAHVADQRHRLVLHNAFGILLAEQVFGPALVNTAGRRVFTRDIGLQHVREDLGFVPSLAECLAEVPVRPWMAGAGMGQSRLSTSVADSPPRLCSECAHSGVAERASPHPSSHITGADQHVGPVREADRARAAGTTGEPDH
jgi:hypothetical protein